MTASETDTTVRSFLVVLYDDDLNELATYEVPVGVTAPFGNRLFREALGHLDGSTPIREPWYTLVPLEVREFERSPLPAGPTSLTGERYDPEAETGPPLFIHPRALVRGFRVCLLDLDQELYRGLYHANDIFLHTARNLLENGVLKEARADGPFYYAVAPSTETVSTVPAEALPEEAYSVEGVFRLPPRTPNRPRVQFRAVPQKPPDERDPASFQPTRPLGSGDAQAGRVFLPEKIYETLHAELPLSKEVEQGGFVLGNVYRQPGSPEKEDDPGFRWVVEVTDLIMAEGTVGNAARLLFTGDSWSEINRRRDRDHPDRKLVGWFHTHVFPATDSFGLSGLDLDLHAWYLPRPWQVAILLNLEEEGTWTVRCYQRGPHGDLVETPFEVF